MRNLQLILVSILLLMIKSASAKPFLFFGAAFWEEEEEIVVSWDQAFPNTLWCCADPIAQNENDIGEDEVTDECCKIHYQCPNKIIPGGTLEDITNNSDYDMFPCECEEAFRTCLQKSISDSKNEKSSKRVGQYYFTTMGDQCFKKEHLIVRCVTEYPNPKRCSQYELDMNSEKSYQWFDVFPF